MLRGGLPKQIFQDWNLRKSGDSRQALSLQVFQHSAHQVGFAFTQAHYVLDFSLADDWLADAPNIGVPGHGRNVHGNFECHFAVGVNVRSYVYIHADIQILELGIDQGIDAHSANAWLK